MSTALPCAAVIGDGAMGTLCALMLAHRDFTVRLWGRSADRVAELRRRRCNDRFLPGYAFPDSVAVTGDSAEALAGAAMIISAVPCQYMREVWAQLGPRVGAGVPIVSVAKGIELDTLLRPTQIIAAFAPASPLACLSGPNIASEIAADKPAGAVAASEDESTAVQVQRALSCSHFRVYTNTDLTGVELAGAAKNVIAIAAGICDGIDGGCNAKASLVTRGLVEISRLGVSYGARAETFQGLAGVGDLITTCISPVGRNRSAGEKIGRGMSARQVMASTPSVIEGIPTTRALLELARRVGVEMPITAAIYEVLFEDKPPVEAIEQLMTRQLRSE